MRANWHYKITCGQFYEYRLGSRWGEIMIEVGGYLEKETETLIIVVGQDQQ